MAPLPPADLPGVATDAAWNIDHLKTAARLFQQDLDDLKAKLKLPGAVTQADLGEYPAAQGLEQTCTNAHTTIEDTYGTFLTQYQAMINTLNTTIANYGKADDATHQAATHVQSWA